MLGLRFSAAALAASFALAGLAFSAPASAHNSHHHHRHHHGQVIIEQYGDAYSSYDEDYGNDTFPNTVDHSAECINGYRWQRHNHDWYKTEAQDTLPLPCN